MAKLMPSEIQNEVRDVLVRAAKGADSPPFLTAYQILQRLPPSIFERLVQERTIGGAGSGVSYSAATVVSAAAAMLAGIEILYIDSADLKIFVGRDMITPGYNPIGIYRLLEQAESDLDKQKEL